MDLPLVAAALYSLAEAIGVNLSTMSDPCLFKPLATGDSCAHLLTNFIHKLKFEV